MDLPEEEFPSLRTQNIRLFTGNANRELANEIAEYLEVPLSQAIVSRFANGEIKVKIEESVRGNDVFIIQPTCNNVNDSLMELLIMCDALIRSSVNSINTIIPYFGYAKQEKKTAGREPITAKLVANLLTVAGASRIVTMDLHAAAIQGFFDIPVDNLYAFPLFEYYYKEKGLHGDNIVIISPDAGGVARAREFAERLDASMAIIFKRRPKPDIAEIVELVGDVKGKTAIMIDDMISTGGTLVMGAKLIKELGANDIYACATHPILAKNCVQMMNDSPIKEVAVTNTIPLPKDQDLRKFTKLSVAPMFAETIRRNFFNLSVSKLFI
ncbi:MAG: ribose-phosphate diphosphokinase [Vulcanimicrobiota bacterium]